MEEPMPGIFKIEAPLPQNPLRAVNCYLIKGEERDLLIDVGMNRDACREALYKALKQLKVDLHHLDLFITHLHADHLGLSSDFAALGATIYFNQEEGELMKRGDFWERLYSSAEQNGFPLKDLKKAIKEHPGYRYGSKGIPSFTYIEEGEEIAIGEYTLTCIKTPGHSPGHFCLYEKKKRALFSGDHILERITPNISAWLYTNPLKSYLESLEKIERLEIHLVLPGHRQVFAQGKRRIQELKDHHTKRNQEVLRILKRGAQTSYQVASRMTWDLRYQYFSQFPIPQQWFATGEALSHLDYLKEEGQVVSQEKEGLIHYSLI